MHVVSRHNALMQLGQLLANFFELTAIGALMVFLVLLGLLVVVPARSAVPAQRRTINSAR